MENEKKLSEKQPWTTAKLIIGIVSMVLFIIICVQSCAAGIGNAIDNNNSGSGSAGFFCALFMLVGGIIAVASRNKKGKGGNIAAIILYWLGAVVTLGMAKDFPDLAIWGAVSFDFGLICLGSMLLTKEKLQNKSKLITIIVLIVSTIIFIIGITSGGDSNKQQDTPKNENQQATKSVKQGEAISYKDINYTVTKVKYSKGGEWDTPASGKEYVIVTVKIENKSDKTISYSEIDWKMKNSKGQIDDTTYASINSGTELSSGDLSSGGTKTGTIVFEEPKNDSSLKLLYYDNSLFDEEETFEIVIK